ncbi:MAG: Icc protein [Cellvibrionaceae bacterium]|jgi:Icc protein
MKFRKLVVVGDQHIEAEQGEHRGVDTADVLQKLVAHVNQHHADADLCLFLGDITNEGEPAAYARFKSLIQPLLPPIRLMVGNHDERVNFQTAFPETEKDENGFVQFVHDFENNYRLIVLDTLNGPPLDELRRHVGMLTPDRLKFLEAKLEEANGRPVVIAMHHHPFEIGLPGMDVIRLMNGPEFLEIVGRYPNIQMVFFGHNHRQISGVSHGVPFTCFKALSPQTPLDFQKLDPSGGIAEPPSYGVVMLSDTGVLVHQEDFLAGVVASSNFQERLDNDPQMAAGYQMLAQAMLPDWSPES